MEYFHLFYVMSTVSFNDVMMFTVYFLINQWWYLENQKKGYFSQWNNDSVMWAYKQTINTKYLSSKICTWFWKVKMKNMNL